MGIFYIGGQVEVALPWSIKDVDTLTAVADGEMDTWTAVADGEMACELHEYGGNTTPGQHWACYRSFNYVEKEAKKSAREADRPLDAVHDT